MKLWERPTGLAGALRDLPAALTPTTLSVGLVTAAMVVMGPTLLVVQAAAAAGFSPEQTGSWLFGVLAAAGLMELALALAYRVPIAVGISLPSSALVVQVLPGFTLPEAVGAYLLCGALITALAATGWFGRLLRLVPPQVVMGSMAGVLLPFVAGVAREGAADPALVMPIVGAWLAASLWRHRAVPPLAAALCAGAAVSLWLHPPSAGVAALGPTLPHLYAPAFSLRAALSLSLPLALIAVGSQNAATVGLLRSLGYRVPADAATWATGLFTLLAAPLGGHGVSLGAPRSALAAHTTTHPDPGLRYGASVADGVLLIGAGLGATALVQGLALFSPTVVRVVAGLAMVPALLQTVRIALGQRRGRPEALFALGVAASGVQVLGVGSVTWALVLGPLLSRALRARRSPKEAQPTIPGP